MKRTFLYNFIFLLYIEIVFHIACFNEFSVIEGIFLFFVSLIFSILITFLSSITKKERLNNIIMRFLWIFLIIIFIAELVYYQIYESFFSINGLFFASAIKGGFDKVLLTIWHNIIPIILLVIPIILAFIKLPKVNSRFNKNDGLVMLGIAILSLSYITFNVRYMDRNSNYSFYNLLFKVNMPDMTVKKFGLMASSSISIERKIFGFKAVTDKSEDILTNTPTSLSTKVKVSYNVDENIDLDKLIQNESNNDIKELHQYFNSQIPTNKNEFTGMFKDKNIIFIVAESFDEIAINKELTPTLYKIKNEGIKFNNYFAPKYPASTADGEYMLEWGTLPIIGENYSLIDMVYNTNPYILPRILKNNGYKTYVYHDYFGYYNRRKKYFSTLNFDGMKYCEEGINTRCDHFHGSDMDMMEQTPADFINNDKFFAYYITLSGHGSYDSSNFVAEKHLSKLSGYNYPYQLKYYMAANIDFDLSMKTLIDKLKESGKLDDTVIIISSDHSPYYLTNDQVNILSSMDRNNKFDRNRGSFIIYNSGLKEHYSIDKYAMNIDVLPTILNMLGLKYDSRLIIGKDIMSTNTEGLVVFPDRSWANNNGSYDTANGKFTPYTSNVDDKYVQKITQDVNQKYNVSVNMQYKDYYKYVFK